MKCGFITMILRVNRSQSDMQWPKMGADPPKKFKVAWAAGKVMATVFWDCKRILSIEYKENDEIINRTFYAAILRRLKEAIKEKIRKNDERCFATTMLPFTWRKVQRLLCRNLVSQRSIIYPSVQTWHPVTITYSQI